MCKGNYVVLSIYLSQSNETESDSKKGLIYIERSAWFVYDINIPSTSSPFRNMIKMMYHLYEYQPLYLFGYLLSHLGFNIN